METFSVTKLFVKCEKILTLITEMYFPDLAPQNDHTFLFAFLNTFLFELIFNMCFIPSKLSFSCSAAYLFSTMQYTMDKKSLVKLFFVPKHCKYKLIGTDTSKCWWNCISYNKYHLLAVQLKRKKSCRKKIEILLLKV